MTRRISLMPVVAAAFALVAGLSAVEVSNGRADPAVSGTNGKLSVIGGGVSDPDSVDEDSGLAGLEGSLTLPLGTTLGVQIDGALASIDGDGFGQTGAHVFWRDPSKGLLGLYGGYAHLDRAGGQDLGRIGAEAQLFLDRLTLDSALGYRFLDVDDEAFGRARVQYYPTDNLMLSGGLEYEGDAFAAVGAEYQLASHGGYAMSLFAQGRVNDEETYGAFGGLRIYFGEDMNLIDRHRRQDPDNYTGQDIQGTVDAALLNNPPPQDPPDTKPKAEACPFTPESNLCCGMHTSCGPNRLQQCFAAGYSPSQPGPSACHCQAAFSNCKV